MAEPERRPGKTPLIKQPEIEEVEEEHGHMTDHDISPNSKDSTSNCLPAKGSNSQMNSYDQDNRVKPTNGSVEANGPTSSPSFGDTAPRASSSEETGAARPKQITSGASLSKKQPLLRGTAVCEGASPPPQPVPEVKVFTTPAPDTDDNIPSVLTTPVLGQPKDGSTTRSPLQKNGSQSSDAGTTSSLSRESSIEKSLYKDSTGVDLEEFIKKTLFKSPKDRKMLLQIERDFKQFVDNQDDRFFQLAEMSSYDRMLVHRMAAFYGLDHNINQSGKCVIVSKTRYTRVPEFSCEEYLKSGSGPDTQMSEQPKRKIILKPKHHSFEERGSRTVDKNQFSGHRTKSLEERQKSYDEKRKQIFGSASQDETSTTVSTVESQTLNKPTLSSRDQWSSTDSSGYGTEDSARRGGRGVMTKSNSYGGKPTIHLTPSNTRTCSLSKADSIQSGSYESPPVAVRPNKLPTQSPENSQSPLSRSSSVDAGPSPNHGFGAGVSGPPYTVLVATDVTTIPPGSMVVNPETLQPHMNPDGTVYRYDPNGPPPPFLAQLPVTPTSACQLSTPSGNISYGTSVQYQDPGEMCNVFSRMTVEGGMDGGAQVMTIPHPHPVPHLQQPQPAHQPGQPHGTQPLIVATSLGQHVPQSPQQFPSSYTSFTAMPTPYYSNAQIVQAPPVRYVITTGPPGHTTPVDSQGQPVAFGGPGANPVPSGVYGAHPQHQTISFIPAASAMQPGMAESVGMAPSAVYGQTASAVCPYTALGDAGSSGSPYSIPYAPVSGMYTYTTYTPPGNGANGTQVGGATFYAPPQSSSPLSFGFGASATGQATIRPATPPSQLHPPHGMTMNIAQPVGYQQTAGGMAHPSHHRVNSPPQYNHYTGTVYAPAPHFPGQVRPVGQVVQVPMGQPSTAASVSVASHTHQHNHHHHHQAPALQHNQSFSLVRSNTTAGATSAANHIGISPAANGNPTPPQTGQHPPVMVKSMSVGCIRPMGGAATPDKESGGMIGGATFMPGINQAAFASPFVSQGLRHAQPGDLRMMGAAGMRPQLPALPLAFTQPGQPIKTRGAAPKQQRGSRRNNTRSGSTAGDGQSNVTTASASVARVISADASVAQAVVNRQ